MSFCLRMRIFPGFGMIKCLRSVSLVMAVSTAITMATPSQSDNVWIQKVQTVLNTLAGNFFYNKNLDDPSVPKAVQDIARDEDAKEMLQEVENLFG